MSDAERTPWVTRWGRDSSIWNIHDISEDDPEEDVEGGDSDGSGFPGRWLVLQAVARWGMTQPAVPSAEMIAAAFNLPLYLAQDIIGDDRAGDLGGAVQVWAGLQDEFGDTVTVGAAAAAFHLSPALIAEAVEAHPWMSLSGDRADLAAMTIDHDGE